MLKSLLAASLLVSSSGVAFAADPFGDKVVPFFQAHCVKCHGPKKQYGDIRLDDITPDMTRDHDRWQAVRDQLRDGLMPPKKEPRPDSAKAREVVAWIVSTGNFAAAKLPNQGNLIPHEALFGQPPSPGEPPAARVWRLSPRGYIGFLHDVVGGKNKPQNVVQPFTLIPERGIRDYSGLYAIDEQSTNILLRNAEAIVDIQTSRETKDGTPRGKNGSVREFVALMDPAFAPTRQQLETAVQTQFRLAIGRAASAEEVTRFIGLYETCAKDGDREGAAKTMLQAVLLRTDAMFRSELGSGEAGRRMLAPGELARAISLALGDRRDSILAQAAQKGELVTREQVAAQIRRMLDDPKAEKPRILEFFHEYFEYPKAIDLFKEKPADRIKHNPSVLLSDTDRLVLYIVNEDKDVFRQLLTTPVSFVNYSLRKGKKSKIEEPTPADVIPPPDPKGKRPPEYIGGVETVYGVSAWTPQQPIELPKETRIGILMQPSWLVAWSTNFDNDVVRRGRWIRERLLGGTVPDLPIGLAAQVPDEKHRTFRDRMTVTHAEGCWKCHQRMDDLGLAFEQFDHYGRFRTVEKVLDLEATAKNVDKKGKPLGPILRDADLSTTGLIADSGDPALDGAVKDPRELLRRLANSDRCRQVFVRHVFRFFLGHNESLSDAKTLQEADRAYVESGGSFKSLIVSLLTSDSFLYRTAGSQSHPEPSAKGKSR